MSENVFVTGAAGFIGSRIVRALNRRGISEIVAVDHLRNGIKFENLARCDIVDYIDRDRFIEMVKNCDALLQDARAVFHQGGCTDTTVWDGVQMMELNFEYSKEVGQMCAEGEIPFLFASSASIYGKAGNVHETDSGFREDDTEQPPLNIYAYSKLLFEKWARRHLTPGSQVVGLRYFNVYGPGEAHKGKMASLAYQLMRHAKRDGVVRLFEGSHGFADGEQRRDFVHVDDVAKVNLWFFDHPEVSGIFNVGTGESRSFNALARIIVESSNVGEIEYLPFPETLLARYQSYTQADLCRLRDVGCDVKFRSLEEGVSEYQQWFTENDHSD